MKNKLGLLEQHPVVMDACHGRKVIDRTLIDRRQPTLRTVLNPSPCTTSTAENYNKIMIVISESSSAKLVFDSSKNQLNYSLFQGGRILSVWSFAWDASVKQHPTAISHFTALGAFVVHSSSLSYTGKRLVDQ